MTDAKLDMKLITYCSVVERPHHHHKELIQFTLNHFAIAIGRELTTAEPQLPHGLWQWITPESQAPHGFRLMHVGTGGRCRENAP